jgi:hypothetical protein
MKRLFGGSLVGLPWLIAFLFGTLTGCAMAGLGLEMRLGNAIPVDGLVNWFGVPFFAAMNLSAGRIGWMFVLEGILLVAALCAFAVRNHWGWWSTTMAGLIAVIFFPGGTLAGIIVLLALGVRLIREKPWKQPAKAGADL